MLGLLAWHYSEQAAALQAQVGALHTDRIATEARLTALQETATVLEDRLATLEANDPAQQIAALQSALAAASGSEELIAVQSSLTELQDRVTGFQASLDTLSARMDVEGTSAPAWDQTSLPPAARLEVARQKQSHNLSCESSAASMVAQYFGLDLTESEVLALLPRNDNPHLGFRGNVDGPTGGIQDYGVYAGPVMDILNGQGLKATYVEGGLAGIKEAIARGNPVIAWVTYNCLPSIPTEATIEGAKVTLVPNQHVVVVIAYSSEGVYANDPWDGQEDFYPSAEFEEAMAYFGDMAIEVAVP
jgi:uncharacterized protein YvpB